MIRGSSTFRRLVLLSVVVAFAVALFGGVAPAHAAAPAIAYCRYTVPIAYELKSLLSTRFYCKVDQPDVTARLDILAAGGIVKTIYNGPIAAANTEFWFPAWNGMDYLGRRLPSASYDWRLTVTKNGESSVARGKITVSKINFYLSGTLFAEDTVVASRYMIPGTVNCYIRAREFLDDPGMYPDAVAPDHATFGFDIDVNAYPTAWIDIPSGTTYTHYIRSPFALTTRGNRSITILDGDPWPGQSGPWYGMDYYMTVIQ